MSNEIKEILDNTLEYLEGIDETRNTKILTTNETNILLDYITNLQEYETIIEMEFKREYAKRYLEERRKEKPHLLYPDSDEIYKRYYELKEENEYSNHCNEELRKTITNLKYKIERLEEDNKKLKELCDKYEEEHSTKFNEWVFDKRENERLKQIIKTANMMEYFKAYDILQGVDKE